MKFTTMPVTFSGHLLAKRETAKIPGAKLYEVAGKLIRDGIAYRRIKNREARRSRNAKQ